ncbi:uncharacterized protein [Magallana gigas]|uniref:uncharacterized protein isoform X2 n=1 Tax=Magallana gigas TaxID=29159 RepID=UPI00333F0A72
MVFEGCQFQPLSSQTGTIYFVILNVLIFISTRKDIDTRRNNSDTVTVTIFSNTSGKDIDTRRNNSDTVTVTIFSNTSGQKPESASCENQKEYLNGFVICLILLTLSVAGNVVQFCNSSRNKSRQENGRSPVSDRQQSRFEPDGLLYNDIS